MLHFRKYFCYCAVIVLQIPYSALFLWVEIFMKSWKRLNSVAQYYIFDRGWCNVDFEPGTRVQILVLTRKDGALQCQLRESGRPVLGNSCNANARISCEFKCLKGAQTPLVLAYLATLAFSSVVNKRYWPWFFGHVSAFFTLPITTHGTAWERRPCGSMVLSTGRK